MKEIWKDVTGYPNYMVSNTGKIKSLNYRRTGREKILKPKIDKKGYQRVGLWKNGVQKRYLLHRLVAQAFIQNPNKYPQVNHKDENPSNNFVDNLEWCDAKYNINYGTRNGKCSKPVLQIDKNTNEIIAEFPSTMEVQRQLVINQSNISECCLGKRNIAGGYKWKYKPTT